MKRCFLAVLVLTLLVSASAPASAAYLSSLSQLQQYIENHSPADLAATGPHYVELDGRIVDLYPCGINNHYEMILQVDDPQATPPLGADSPQLVVHFRLHLDEPPFRIGDTITVFGSVNELYSSVIVPVILAETINGSDDF